MARERRDAAVGLRMTSALKADLEKLAEADDRTLASYIERILREHVATLRAENGKPTKRKWGAMEMFATEDTASKIGSGIGTLIAIGVYCLMAYAMYLGLFY
jgi:hypothetical protein